MFLFTFFGGAYTAREEDHPTIHAGVLLFFFFPGLPPVFDDILSFWYVIIGPLSLVTIVLLIASAFFGTPLFVVLGGIGLFLFAHSGGAMETVPNEAYSILISETIPVTGVSGMTILPSEECST